MNHRLHRAKQDTRNMLVFVLSTQKQKYERQMVRTARQMIRSQQDIPGSLRGTNVEYSVNASEQVGWC